MAENILASDIQSVGSCESELRDRDDDSLESLNFHKIYLNTHAGSCLQTVLQELMLDGDINVVQKSELEREFNRIYFDAYSQCQSKLHVSLQSQLLEYSSIQSGSIFNLADCLINGPSSSLKVPKGVAKLVHSRSLD